MRERDGIRSWVRRGVEEKFSERIKAQNPGYDPTQIQVALKALDQEGVIDDATDEELRAATDKVSREVTVRRRWLRALGGAITLILGYIADYLLNKVTSGQVEGFAFWGIVFAMALVQLWEVFIE